jgi:hypothetical protein
MIDKNLPHPPQPQNGLTKPQIYTAAGLLGVVTVASMAKDIVPVPLLLAASVGYGIGSSASVALYRVAGLLKNGTPDMNVFGSGALAGLAVAFGMTAIQSVPAIIGGDYIKGLNFASAMVTGIAGLVAGFLQSRSNFEIIANQVVPAEMQR